MRSTFRPEVVGDIGGFGGLFSFDPRHLRDPLLVSSTDGVGTKSLIARLTNRYDTIGIDLVAMSVDDIAVQGAEPLFFLDYISIGKLVPSIVDDIVAGVAHGCREAGCALLGGEMSEHPDLMEPHEFDLVGFAVGVVERAGVLPAGVRRRRRRGDREPGASLQRLLPRAARASRTGRATARRSRVERCASLAGRRAPPTPSVIYAPAMRKLRERVEVHAFAHITGGGIPGNLMRVLPPHCDAVVHVGTWEEPRIFDEIRTAGNVTDDEMQQVFNLGLGMLAVVPHEERFATLDVIRASGHEAWVVGEIVEGRRRVAFTAA